VLRKASKDLTETVKELARRFREPFDPDGPTHLWVALSAAFTIGHFAFRNPITERIKRDAQRARTMLLKAKSRKIDEVILRHAKPFLVAEKPVARTKIASEIVDRVNGELKRKELSLLGTGAIEKRLRELVKLRTDQRSN
jgi:hypothetical protein